MTLRDTVARALHEHHAPGVVFEDWCPDEYREIGDAVLAALGLGNWEAAVDRGGNALADECQDRYGFRPALGQRDILAEVVLRAALQPEGEKSP